MKMPYVSISLGGVDLIPKWGGLLIDATVTDERGGESDKLGITLDDAGGRIVYPRTGDVLVVEGGYREVGAAVVGEFTVDEVALEGWPQKVTIRATSVDAKAKAKERRSETHKASETPTLGDLFTKIAGRNGLTPAIGQGFAAIPIEQAEHQTEEDDFAFLTRIARRHDGMMAIKQGRLVALLRASGETASGAPIAPIVIALGDGLKTYRVSWKDKPVHGKVETRFFDRALGEPVTVEVAVGDSTEDVVARIREPFATRAEAERAAEARARELTDHPHP